MIGNNATIWDLPEVDLEEAAEQDAALPLATETGNFKLKISIVKEAMDGVNSNGEAIELITEDLSGLQGKLETLIGQLATQLDKDVQTRTEIEATDSNIFVRIEMTNIKTGHKETVVKEMPLASDTQAGGIDTVMYNAFVQMQADITEIYNSMQGMPKTAVVAGMAEDPSQSDITAAFTSAMGEEPNANDRLVNVDFNVEYIYSSEGVWSYLGRSAIGFATSQTDGIVKHSVIAGTVGYYVEGVGQVNGWDELVAAVGQNKTNMDWFLANNRLNAVTATTVIGIDNPRADINIPANTADCLTYFNTAVSRIPASGGKIVVLEGTYPISTCLEINNKTGLVIEGMGVGTKIVRTSPNDTTTSVNLSEILQASVICLNACDSCEVKNLKVDFQNTGAGNCYGISIYSSSNNTVTGNTCSNTATSTGACVGIQINSGSNNTVTGNTCSNTSTGNCYGIQINSGSNNTVTGNTCSNTATSTGNCYGISIYSSSNNNTVTGNTFAGKTANVTNTYVFDIPTGNNYNLVTNNNARNWTQYNATLLSGSNIGTPTTIAALRTGGVMGFNVI